MLILGAHTIDNGGIHMAVRRAARSGMRALQVFTAKPQFYNEKISVRPERVERFKAALAETEIRPEHIVAHAAYVLSVATPDDAKYERATLGSRRKSSGPRRSASVPCASTRAPRSTVNDRSPRSALANAITRALETVPGTTRLLVENTAGRGPHDGPNRRGDR